MARPPLQVGTHGAIRTYGWIDGRWLAKSSLPDGARPDTWRAVTNFRYANGKTKPIERSGSTEAKAKRALRDALAKLTERKSTLTSQSKFRDVATAWLEQVKKNPERADTTHDRYHATLKNLVLDRIGDLRLPELTIGTLEELFSEYADEGHSANYRRSARTVIRGPLSLAVRRELIDANPVRELSPIEGKTKKVRSLTPDERVDLLRGLDELVADNRYYKRSDLPDFVRFLIGTGVRIGEAVAVRWRDLNLTDKKVFVDGTEIAPHSVWINGNIVDVVGEGLKRHDGKTENADRQLALPQFLVAMLMVRRDADAVDDEPVFPSETLGWKHPNNVRRSWRSARAELGYEWVTPHVFRKTAATILDDTNMTARQIADQLGHAKPSMTQDVYMGRGSTNPAAAAALHDAYSRTD